MSQSTAQPMHIRQFLVCWIGAAYLLWPLMIIPTVLGVVLLDSRYTVNDWSYVYWSSTSIKAVNVAVFTFAVAVVQAWMFRRLLHIRIRHWRLLTIAGGCLGALVMGLLDLKIPFEMLPWFIGISVAQWWAIHKMVKNSWIWILAHLALSLFFPIYGQTVYIIVMRWMFATTIYGATTLVVLYQLAQDARIDKVKSAET
jgi:hypothetical protein